MVRVLSKFELILMGRELVTLLCLSSWCIVSVIILWLFHTVPLVGLRCVIVLFLDHTHLLFGKFTITDLVVHKTDLVSSLKQVW